jgi:hypothetical protein
MEIQPETGRKFDRFLVVLKPDIKDQSSNVGLRCLNFEKLVGVRTDRSVVLFGKNGLIDGSIHYRVPKDKAYHHIILDVPKDREVVVKFGGKDKIVRTSKSGVLAYRIKAEQIQLSVN